MALFSDDSEQAAAYNQVVNAPHKADLSNELIAAAASYHSVKGLNERTTEEAIKDDIYKRATPLTDILNTSADEFIDRIAETKGLDSVDREGVKRQAFQLLADASSQDS